MMLDLTDEETDALARLLSRTIDDDRYPLSPRIQNLKGILAKLRPEPVHEPLPPLKHYEPAREGDASDRKSAVPTCPLRGRRRSSATACSKLYRDRRSRAARHDLSDSRDRCRS